jgi:hypothetical protein
MRGRRVGHVVLGSLGALLPIAESPIDGPKQVSAHVIDHRGLGGVFGAFEVPERDEEEGGEREREE